MHAPAPCERPRCCTISCAARSKRTRTFARKTIVVMTPDLDTYAPVFRAVFGERGEHRIPYEIHDRKTREDASFYDDFLAILEVLDSRFSVLDVVRLMDSRSLQ